MEFIRRRRKRPETRRLVERRWEIANPPQRGDAMTRMRKEQREFRRGRIREAGGNHRVRQRHTAACKEMGGCQSTAVSEDDPEQIQLEKQLPEEPMDNPKSEGKGQIIRGNNLPLVNLKMLQHRKQRSK